MTSAQKAALRTLTYVRPKTAADIAPLVAGGNPGATGRCLRSLIEQGKVEQVVLANRGEMEEVRVPAEGEPMKSLRPQLSGATPAVSPPKPPSSLRRGATS